MTVPGWWQFVLLALGAYRLYRIGAKDTITEPIRAALTYPDELAVSLGDGPDDDGLTVIGLDGDQPKSWRVYLSTLIRCPWCAGFWVSLAVWAAWLAEPDWTTFASSPLALSTVVGLAKKNLDR